MVKPCTGREVSFYESSLAHPSFARWMPTFYGTLSLSDPGLAKDTPGGTPNKAPTHDRQFSLVLQNLMYGFVQPCIMDMKLGARLWDEFAPQEKRDRLDAMSDKTTSRSMGMRVAGMKVWKGSEVGYEIYDKLYGRTFTAENVDIAMKEYFSADLQQKHVKILAERFLGKVKEIRILLEEQESRIYGASFLFVYEGDAKALDAALEEERTRIPKPANDDDDNDDDDNDEKIKMVEELKMIDFAHAKWTPGEGPDKNILQGVRSVEKLLQGLV
jgi:1D-myo-inositol-tetrakisphosphate 5-kinase/inositol-polyphosphate multikinase